MNEPTKASQPTRVQKLWKIFLLTAFPIHVWNLLMVFKDMEFVTERSEMWGAIGYAGYSLLYAFLESIIIAILIWIISLLIPRKWDQTRAFTALISVYFVLAGASAVEQAAYAFEQYRIAKQFIYGLENFTTLTYGLIIGAIFLAIAGLLLLIYKTKNGGKALAEFYDRLILLSYLYLVLDAAGIVIVIIRNIPSA
ncbi:MAG TPA: hypothetical protein VJ965_11040 [Anaerolineales bacterium]|nr:hypothetical protein [Anaerolineales bacterium]